MARTSTPNQQDAVIGVVLAAKGYPEASVKGSVIKGLISKRAVFHMGDPQVENELDYQWWTCPHPCQGGHLSARQKGFMMRLRRLIVLIYSLLSGYRLSLTGATALAKGVIRLERYSREPMRGIFSDENRWRAASVEPICRQGLVNLRWSRKEMYRPLKSRLRPSRHSEIRERDQ